MGVFSTLNSRILTKRTLNKAPPIFGNSHMGLWLEVSGGFRIRGLSSAEVDKDPPFEAPA